MITNVAKLRPKSPFQSFFNKTPSSRFLTKLPPKNSLPKAWISNPSSPKSPNFAKKSRPSNKVPPRSPHVKV